ncbi:MAG: protein O-GlcNAc transferase, partial [Gammaproteobacteria bacterium]
MSDQLDQPMAVDEALQVAISHHQLGRLTEAEAIYRQVLAAHPHHPDALHFLGLIAHQLGNNALAQELIENAIQVNPNNPAYYSNLGFVVREQGRVDEAINHYQYAIQLQPDYADAHYNLGVALKAHGQLDGAINCYQRVIALQSDYAQAYSDLGIALRDQGRLDEAVSRYQHAIGLQPDYADAHSNLGLALQEQGKLDEAISCYQRAIALKPDFAEAHYNLGGALHECGLFDEAISRYSKTLALNPDLVEAHYNFGNVLHEVGQIDAAISCYQRAIALKPDFARAHNNLGNALKDLGQLISAVSSYRRALTIKADYAKAHSNLLFTYNYLCHQAADVLLGEAQRFGDAVELQARPFSTWCINAQIDRCLRVGLVSGDFRVHPVGFFIESVLAALTADAADQLHFFAYTTNLRADALSARIEACCDGWQSVVGLSDQRLAQLIHDDEIDILIDLSGHTGRNRLPMFAYKPAPIQVSWLGYFATTGVAAIDYLLADPWTLPPSEEAHFSEKIWRLPETRLCFTAPDVALEVAPLPALRNAYVTFGCF